MAPHPMYFCACMSAHTTKGGINKTKTGKKRFAAGQLLGNRPLHTPGNEVQELAFWKVFPESKALRNAKLFLLGD